MAQSQAVLTTLALGLAILSMLARHRAMQAERPPKSRLRAFQVALYSAAAIALLAPIAQQLGVSVQNALLFILASTIFALRSAFLGVTHP